MRPFRPSLRNVGAVIGVVALLLAAGFSIAPHSAASLPAPAAVHARPLPSARSGSAVTIVPGTRPGLSRQADPTAAYQWINVTATAGPEPPPRISGGLVFDAADNYTLLFGGEYFNASLSRTIYYNDTWEYSGGLWTNITNSVAPSPRFGFGLAFDAADREVVLFGGNPAHGPSLNDTWTFAGGLWSNVTQSYAPPARFWPSMSYDAGVLLFGGIEGASTQVNDTWVFEAGNWSQITTTRAPSPRHGAGMAFDPDNGLTVLFGGLGASTYLNDTWIWTGSGWTNVTNTSAPDPRVGPGFTYDEAIHRGVLYGGFPASFTPYDTWLLSGTVWTDAGLLANSPPLATVWGQFAYDARDEWVVYVVPNVASTYVFNATGAPSGPLSVQASVSPLSGPAPLTVTLNSTISGGVPPYDLHWRANGTNLTSLGNATATFNTPGVRLVSLTVVDDVGSTVQMNWTVNVLYPTLTAQITIDPNPAVVGLTVDFDSLPSGGLAPYTFAWTFGDGGSADTQNASHVYANAGTFPVTYNVTSGNATYVNTALEVTILGAFNASASLSPVGGTAPMTVLGSSTTSGGLAPYSFRWSWGDGTPDSTDGNPSHVYTRGGSFEVNSSIWDSEPVYVNTSWTIELAAPLVLSISISPTAASPGQNVSFTSILSGGAAPFAYAWTFGDGSTSSIANTSHIYDSVGQYLVKLVVTDKNGATVNRTATVTVQAPSTSSSDFLSTYWWIIPVLVAAALAVLFLVLLGRRRRREPPPDPAGGPAAKPAPGDNAPPGP